IIYFPFPSPNDIARMITVMLQDDAVAVPRVTLDILSIVFEGKSFADVRKAILAAQRESLVKHSPIEQALQDMIPKLLEGQSHSRKVDIAVSLHQRGWPERLVNKVTGIARDTFRKKSLKMQTRRRRTHGAKA